MDKLTVKQWRVMNDMSQDNLAKLLGIHRNTYQKKEQGKLQFTAKEIAIIIELSGLNYSQLSF